MEEWLTHAVESLQRWRSDIVYVAEGNWVLMPAYRLPAGWNKVAVDVAFQIPNLPGERPYSFLVRDGLTLSTGTPPTSYTFPVDRAVPFDGQWGQFSWELDSWQPGNRPGEGTTIVHFVQSFAHRLKDLS